MLSNGLVREYRRTKVILSNRDKLFISNFLKSLTRRLDIKPRILTIYYLKMNE